VARNGSAPQGTGRSPTEPFGGPGTVASQAMGGIIGITTRPPDPSGPTAGSGRCRSPGEPVLDVLLGGLARVLTVE
jgi:hypothetical protein